MASQVAAATKAPIADASERLDWAGVCALIDRGANVNAAQVDGMTALHWSVYHDHLKTTKKLMAAGANVTARNRYGVTPLSLACLNGNGSVVRLLLDAGVDPNTSLAGGETALMTAARTGRLDPVRALVEHGAEVNARECKGQTALMWAAAEGHTQVVRALLAEGADFQTPLKSGFTPLFFAVREGHAAVVLALLAAGADVNRAMQPARPSAKGPRAGTSPLMLAVENGHFQLAAALLDAGADPNDHRSGFTALHALSWVRKPNRGDGADGGPAPVGSGNLTSLQLVRALVAHGADVNARIERGRSGRGRLNRTGATPFLLAADTADVPYMKLLVELGADPLLANADHCTPLLAAAGVGTLAPGEEAGTEKESLAAVRLILEYGGDINAVDDHGETAMHGAAYKSLPKMVQLLADRGANIAVWNRRNKYGWTPLMIAQGHRVGNFKPSAETVAALEQVLQAAGSSADAK